MNGSERVGEPKGDSKSRGDTRVSESLRVELGAGEHMCRSAYTGMANDGEAAPERDVGSGANKGRFKSRNHRWIDKRVCEERTIREDGKGVDGRRKGRGIEEGGEEVCGGGKDGHGRGQVVVANVESAHR